MAPYHHPSFPDAKTETKLIAHRGASATQPENTLAAFERAIELGVPMIEFDVRRTLDNVLVIHHDETVQGHLLRSFTYGELQANVITRFIPTLEAVLKQTAGRVRLDIELKEAGYEAEVLELVLCHFAPEQFVVTSAQVLALQQIKALNPAICTGYVAGQSPRKFLLTRPGDYMPVRRLRQTGADFMACNYLLADLLYLRRLGSRGVSVMIWTVDTADRLRRYLADERVVGVISNLDTAAQAHLALRDHQAKGL